MLCLACPAPTWEIEPLPFALRGILSTFFKLLRQSHISWLSCEPPASAPHRMDGRNMDGTSWAACLPWNETYRDSLQTSRPPCLPGQKFSGQEWGWPLGHILFPRLLSRGHWITAAHGQTSACSRYSPLECISFLREMSSVTSAPQQQSWIVEETMYLEKEILLLALHRKGVLKIALEEYSSLCPVRVRKKWVRKQLSRGLSWLALFSVVYQCFVLPVSCP